MRRLVAEQKPGNRAQNRIGAAFPAAVLAIAGFMLYLGAPSHTVKASGPESAKPAFVNQSAATRPSLSSRLLSLPMFFEPNQGQTDPQVKFLARGAGYGLFLTADEAVLELQHAIPNPRTATALPPVTSSLIRMRLEGANSSARVSGLSPLPGKSSYFIGNDRSKWRTGVPQFARVEYQSVYPGVNLVYYGNQGQFEYDFRVAPGADPNQIALSFNGASVHIDSAGSGDMILCTANGDVRFHAPSVYQPAAPGNAAPNSEKKVAGSFRQLADNKIGFTVGPYDHSRELVIDPVLSYSTYLGAGNESLVKVAIDAADNIYLAGSTASAYFFPYPPPNGQSPPLQHSLNGEQNLFIAKINPTPPINNPELEYATYLGGNGTDSLAGIAIDSSFNIYVAGSTNSSDFPTTPNAFQQPQPETPGTHGFLSAITLGLNAFYTLTYSTYLSGNGTDTVTGMAIDNSCITQSAVAACNAYVTGVTTSSDAPGNGFPANPNAYQIGSNSPGNPQFFASKIYTAGTGFGSMLYSTYFGGGNFGTTDVAIGGGIAVDPTSSNVNMYFTGATNQQSVTGTGGTAPFPLFNAQQSCLNEANETTCSNTNNTTTPDAFVAKINPNQPASSPVYSTYLGGSGNDYAYAIAVDSASNAYVVGATNSIDWQCSCLSAFQPVNNGFSGATNGFIAKVGSLVGSQYLLTYFTYLGGSGPDSIQDIKVDSVGAAYVVGTTSSPQPTFPITIDDMVQTNYGGGASDAFVASISTTTAGTFPGSTPPGDYSTYLGGSGTDLGTGIAVDVFGNAYAAGSTQSPNFPVTPTTAYQPHLVGTTNAFVSKIGAYSVLNLTVPNTSPAPNPVAAGTQVAFTFNITNTGTDNANLVVFNATGLPTSGLTGSTTAKVTQGTGSCNQVQGSTITCGIPTLAVCPTNPCTTVQAAVEVDMTPAVPVLNQTITVSGNVSANGGPVQVTTTQPVANVVDFSINPTVVTPVVSAGDTATIQVAFCPTNTTYGYNGTITPSQTTTPSMVVATTPNFNPTTVTLSGSACATTTLSIATVARPVNSSGLLHRGSFYATWLPIAGLSLAGLGIATGRKRRFWLLGALLCLIAGILVVLPGCGSASTATPSTTGTQAGTYTITLTGSAGSAASHQAQVLLQVN